MGLGIITGGMANLRKLFLNHNEIDGDGLKDIGRLKELRVLDLRCNKIGDNLGGIGSL